VLDVGAGTGRLAVPIARTAAHVTALDPSEGMLNVLRERMAAERLTNYSCVKMRLEDAVIGRDIEPHDLVIAAFSLGFYDLAAALEKLDSAATRAVHLFWHAGEWRGPEEMALYRAVFGEEATMRKGYPDYIFPVNILHDAGVYTNVRIYNAVWETVYDSPEEAARTWAAMHNPRMEDLSPVRDYFARVLYRDEAGKYVETTRRPTAAVWWEK
jgi:Methylase involved in ubiquinone/menaquinone biosynthesis